MKRFIIILIAVIATLSVSTQEIKAQSQDLNARVDSLSAKLEKLQHDFDFLQCKYDLQNINNKLSSLGDNASMNSNSTLIKTYHGGFYSQLYDAYRANYDSMVGAFELFKEEAKITKFSVKLKMLSSNLTEQEKALLEQMMNTTNSAINKAEHSLKTLKITIDMYKSLD
ncbi:MAG: hypothetical protein II256_03915 [Bacteroidales bacterium]|nr:hypothetical protein [Bacteroidales bacterium]